MTAEAAAALLGTSTAILSVWEERFGFPVPVRSDDGQRVYPDEAMIALRLALARTFSVASAITEARRMQTGGPRTPSAQAGPLEKPEEAR
jgi:MerR family transcriptional regulator, light-induced transcriptional regulator